MLNPKQGARRAWRQTLLAWALLAPALVLLTTFTLSPALSTLLQSVMSTPSGQQPTQFVGARHYAQMLADPVFRQVMRNNLLYALVSIPTSIALALLMALLVNARIPGRALARMAYFTPTVLPLVANAGAKQIGLGYWYNLSKRTMLYANYSRISNDANALYTVGIGNDAPMGPNGSTSSGLMFGMKHTF